jgi:hypothetical protein
METIARRKNGENRQRDHHCVGEEDDRQRKIPTRVPWPDDDFHGPAEDGAEVLYYV